jgi:hypothetical protein
MDDPATDPRRTGAAKQPASLDKKQFQQPDRRQGCAVFSQKKEEISSCFDTPVLPECPWLLFIATEILRAAQPAPSAPAHGWGCSAQSFCLPSVR